MYIVLLLGLAWKKASYAAFDLVVITEGKVSLEILVGTTLVDCKFLCFLFKWPFAIAIKSGRYLLTFLTSRRFHVAN